MKQHKPQTRYNCKEETKIANLYIYKYKYIFIYYFDCCLIIELLMNKKCVRCVKSNVVTSWDARNVNGDYNLDTFSYRPYFIYLLISTS